MTNFNCGTCRWFEGSDLQGRCKANPPQIGADGLLGVWPYVSAEEWCGKHTLPRPTRTVKDEGLRGPDLVRG